MRISMVFRNAVELIYEKCAKRVSDKVQESSLKLDEIYKDNPKVISLIQNNRRDQTHNRYLMTDTALEHLVCKLDFKNEHDVLWGNEDEIRSYALQLFIAMVKDSDYDSDIDPILCAYVSYAQCRTYFKILFQENTFPGITAFEYGVSEDAIMNEIDMARYYASIFLFTECKEEIFQSFLEFTKKTTSFKKLPVVIEKYYQKELMAILRNYREKSHALGYRVEELIYGDLRFIPDLKQSKNNATKDLIKVTLVYMQELELIQKKQMESIYKDTFGHLLEVGNY